MTPTLREPAEHISERARLRWLLGGIGSVVFWAVVWTGLYVWWRPPLGWLGYVVIAVLAVPYLALMPKLRWRTHRWEATPTAIYVQSGWLGRKREIAPMSRVQTVEFTQGPVDRMLGLANVAVNTAAGDLSIAGLDAPVAEELSSRLTAAAEADQGDAT